MILTFENVSFGYGNTPEIITNGSFSIAPGGERLFLVGPSGTGKSTIMKIALGLLLPKSGLVTNQAVRPIPIMQNFYGSLLPWLTVKRNLLFGLNAEAITLSEDLISLFEIEPYLNSHPTELSGGQLQRVLFARALCHQPDLILLDEPLSHLDLPASNRVLNRLDLFLAKHRISAFWITHRHFEARVLANRVIHLENQNLRALQVQELADLQTFTT